MRCRNVAAMKRSRASVVGGRASGSSTKRYPRPHSMGERARAKSLCRSAPDRRRRITDCFVASPACRPDGTFPRCLSMRQLRRVGMPGVFLCLEGVDGGRKSAVAYAGRLAGRRATPRSSSAATRAARSSARRSVGCCSMSGIVHLAGLECLLYMASRAQLVAEIIAPAARGRRTSSSPIATCSTIVYQRHAAGIDPEDLRRWGELATGVMPDWYGVLDVDLAVAARRRRRGRPTASSRSDEYHQRVRGIESRRNAIPSGSRSSTPHLGARGSSSDRARGEASSTPLVGHENVLDRLRA